MSRPPVRRLKSSTTATPLSAVRSPGTTLTTSRLSASIATWSQVSPLRSSAGSSGARFFSFLATKAHFSSNWTSRVRGGKSDQLVVQVAGMFAGEFAQAADGAPVHLAEPAGLADSASLGDVLQDRLDLPRRQPRVEQGRPLPLGEAALAGGAAEHAPRLVGAVAARHGQVSGAPLAVLGAAGIQAAEAGEVVHGAAPPVRSSRPDRHYVIPSGYTDGAGVCNRVRPRGNREAS